MPKSSTAATDAIVRELRAFGLEYPGATTKSPWPDHCDLVVKDKTFAFLSVEGEPLGISCKLPRSRAAALRLPFTKPTEYGLGKSGWVSASFPDGGDIPVALLKAWIDESYHAQAPKRLAATARKLDEGDGAAATASPKPAKRAAKGTKRATAKTAKTAAKKTRGAKPAASRSSRAAKRAR
jgi:predicted DNA-binding protein (MmcQ/YjbR family)